MPRRARNEGKPKKPLSAYMLFCAAKRPEVKAANPDLKFGPLGKLLGEQWKALNESDREKYDKQASADKIRYTKEMAAYKEDNPDSSEDEKSKPAKKKRKVATVDKDAPKKPCSAFVHFSKEARPRVQAENPTAKFGEIGKLLGAAWQALGPTERKKYNDIADEDKKRYEKANGEYQAKKTTTTKKKPAPKSRKKAASESEEEEEESEASEEQSASESEDDDGSD
eukprot:TRINITY_DN1134_c1_g1_i1.p1 TRINITY_DN1134_c1_g1~~TRINITY_DN1134_c1_g1_i1.p1  ORF type:complete len:225 (-),score=71.08 TRINITY_DN1134_c1_g1_i1:97-771(-)